MVLGLFLAFGAVSFDQTEGFKMIAKLPLSGPSMGWFFLGAVKSRKTLGLYQRFQNASKTLDFA